MPTTKKRLNITLSKDIDDALRQISRRDRVPEATKASELLAIALEIEEDRIFGAVARERMKNPIYVDHKEAWKRFTK